MKYQQLGQEIIKDLGGKENIVSVTHCMTRLRFTLKDFNIPDEKKIKEVEGIIGVVNQGGQYQIIIGTHVKEVFEDVKSELGLKENPVSEVSENVNIFNRFFKMISGCIFPIIYPLVGGGILKGILAALAGLDMISVTGGTYQILFGAADAIFYFFPVIVGFSAAKVFKVNQYLGATIGAALIYPSLVSAESLSFLGISVVSASYANTIFPIIVAVWFASLVNKVCNKIIPSILHNTINPTIILTITVPVTYLVIGPIVNLLSVGLLHIFTVIYEISPPVVGLIMSGLWQLLVLLGIHMAIIPMFINEIATNGYSYIAALPGLGHFGLVGMALGIALGVKNKKKKANAVSSLIVSLCGITEPAIYSIAIINVKYFVCAMIGSGVAGFIMALFRGTIFGTGVGGLFAGAMFISPNGFDRNFVLWVICASTATIISAILSYIVTQKENKIEMES